MSKYSVMLRYLVENNYNLGLLNYPIFDETYRTALNNKIINHYKFQEIGFETPGLFVDRLNCKMEEIMPLYNQFYQSSLIKYEVFQTYNLQTVSNRKNNTTNNGTTTATATGENNTKNVQSDTPSTLLSMPDIENEVYATTASISKDTSNDTNNSSINSTVANIDDYTSRVFGTDSARTNTSILTEFRDSFINIDMMVINDLRELFMYLY